MFAQSLWNTKNVVHCLIENNDPHVIGQALSTISLSTILQDLFYFRPRDPKGLERRTRKDLII